ncbi:MAG: HipA domain-containing protein [Candidatus Riflebacteria bacterium]
MKKHKCLYCYQSLDRDETDFHSQCCQRFFGRRKTPELPYALDQMLELARQVLNTHKTVTGVQPKLSLGLSKGSSNDTPDRLTIVGLWGEFILKPPSSSYPELPELEGITMKLANQVGLKTVPHSLIRLASGELAYITRRIDRPGKNILHMEDMCQLTGRLTEQKYNGSYEQIGRAIMQFSVNPGLDIVNFFEQVAFSFLTGNNDMHLKNFSLIKNIESGYGLCPAYDMVASSLLIEDDNEELALTLNARKRKISRQDFFAAGKTMKIPEKTIEGTIDSLLSKIASNLHLIKASFLTRSMQQKFITLIKARISKLEK